MSDGGSWFAENVTTFEVVTHALSPVEADVRVRLAFRVPADDVQVRGRLVGPRCAYASTVEVAYPLRPLPAQAGAPDTLTARAIIPEPSLWEPTCPFLYEGPVEAVRGGEVVFRRQVRHGLRTVQLGPRGLRWNGQPLSLRGVARDEFGEEDASRLRAAGVNLLVASGGLAGPALGALLSEADRLGTLVLPRTPLREEDLMTVASWREHSSCLGWLLSQDRLDDPSYRQASLAHLAGHSGQLLGVELTRPPAAQLPRAIAFVACGEHLLKELENLPLPKLLLVPPGRGGAAAEVPGLLGRVEV